MVKWVSGLNHQFAKLTYGKLYRGFESLFHRLVFVKINFLVRGVAQFG